MEEEASEQQMQMPPVERIDELIGVFQNSTTREWRRLIACSRHWDVLRDGVFARIDERAKGAESDDEPGEALELRRLLRRMRKVDGEVAAGGACGHRAMASGSRNSPRRNF